MENTQFEFLDRGMPIVQRIALPQIWEDLACGIRIQDLQNDRYEEALNVLQDYYINEEVLCKASLMEKDPVSVQQFLSVAYGWLKDSMSLCAINLKTGQMVGLLINRAVFLLDHNRTFSRISIVPENDAFKNVMNMRWHVHKKFDIFEHFNVESYFRLYAICVQPRHRNKGVGMALMQSAVKMARGMQLPVIAGIFTGYMSQRLAAKVGMEELFEVMYSSWLDKDEDYVFSNPGAGNYAVIFMGMKTKFMSCKPGKSFTGGQGLQPTLEEMDQEAEAKRVEAAEKAAKQRPPRKKKKSVEKLSII